MNEAGPHMVVPSQPTVYMPESWHRGEGEVNVIVTAGGKHDCLSAGRLTLHHSAPCTDRCPRCLLIPVEADDVGMPGATASPAAGWTIHNPMCSSQLTGPAPQPFFRSQPAFFSKAQPAPACPFSCMLAVINP
jgi:hypothetical protein